MSLHVETYTAFIFQLATLRGSPYPQAKQFLNDNPEWLKALVHDKISRELKEWQAPPQVVNRTLKRIGRDKECTALVDTIGIRQLLSLAEKMRVQLVIPEEQRSEETIAFIDQLLNDIDKDYHEGLRLDSFEHILKALSSIPEEERLECLMQLTPFVKEIDDPHYRISVLSGCIRIWVKLPKTIRTPELYRHLPLLFNKSFLPQQLDNVIQDLEETVFDRLCCKTRNLIHI